MIEGINDIFETIFSESLGGIAYGKGQRLVVGKPSDYRGLCEIDVLENADAASDAAVIAARIRKMQAEGYPVRGEGWHPPVSVRGLLHSVARPSGLCCL